MISTLYPIFQKWSEKGSVYIVSDTHFDDEDCKLMDSNWLTPKEHLQNIKTTKNDTLIHLGDVGNTDWIKQIKGYKVLIMGNHDIGKSNYERKVRKFDYDFPTYDDAYKAIKNGDIDYCLWNASLDIYEGYVDNHLFDEVYTGPLMIAEKIILSHEPVNISWAFNIHGHNHNPNEKNDILHFNCASNVVGYKMIDLNKIIKSGYLKKINSLHKETIDKAKRKKN